MEKDRSRGSRCLTQVAYETEAPTSTKMKSVEKLAIQLWLEVNLGGEEVPMAGKVTSIGASAYGRAMHLTGRVLFMYLSIG